MMTKAQLITLIHVARREKGLDEDTYRQLLVTATGKDSCRGMSLEQLNAAYDAFKERGFKRSFKADKKGVKTRSPEHMRTEIIGKIRAVWLEMHRHKIIICSSDAALNAYVEKMTKSHNDGTGVARIEWLNVALATQVVETLKKWHVRVMRERLNAVGREVYPTLRGYTAIAELYNKEVQRGNIAI
ncbi:gp16 family protein [Rahnella contaminans]|uniref:gp16 family protein n=1 Tax=Rahnella contaminans TaxID=2703882 RepID=UPI003C2E5E9E